MFAMQSASHLGSVEYWKPMEINNLNFASSSLQRTEPYEISKTSFLR